MEVEEEERCFRAAFSPSQVSERKLKLIFLSLNSVTGKFKVTHRLMDCRKQKARDPLKQAGQHWTRKDSLIQKMLRNENMNYNYFFVFFLCKTTCWIIERLGWSRRAAAGVSTSGWATGNHGRIIPAVSNIRNRGAWSRTPKRDSPWHSAGGTATHRVWNFSRSNGNQIP